LGRAEKYVLYAPTAQNRRDWCDKIREAQEKYASALASQNANPFRLKVLSKNLLAQREVMTGKQTSGRIRGTPLDRALEEAAPLELIGRDFGTKMLCADTYARNGSQILVIGTDKGIQTLGEEGNGLRRWNPVRCIDQELQSKANKRSVLKCLK